MFLKILIEFHGHLYLANHNIIKNLDEYSLSEEEKRYIQEGNFELHQKNISKGHNQDPILEPIREDDFDLLRIIQTKLFNIV